MKRSFFQAAVASILLYGCTTGTLTKRLEKKLDGNYTRMLRAILNKSWRQHPTRHQLYDHLPPITKTIQVRRTRHAGHCWRSRDELISDVLLWTPTHGRAKAGRPARTYIQQLCEDTGCCPEDLPEAMNDWEKWRERARDIRVTSTTWWWWWWWYIYNYNQTRWRTSMNEGTHFFIKIYLSHFILERFDVSCVWEMSWRQGQTATYWLQVLLTIAALLLILAGLLNCGLLRAQALCLELVLTPLASYLQLTQAVCVLVIFLFDPHLLPLIYTGASLDWQLGWESICNKFNDYCIKNYLCGMI